MENEIENANSENGENADNEELDANALKEKLQNEVKEKEDLAEKNRQLFARAKKAEGFVEKDGEWIKKEKSDEKPEAPPDKPNEPDYGRLAFLQSKGIDHPDDIKIVQDEADRLKLPLTDVLGMEHIKTQLKEGKETREAKEGMPKGGGRAGGSTPSDVAHWLDKEGLPEDQELAEKVVDARMGKEKNDKFSDIPFTG